MIELIGTNAGLVWNVLNEGGKMSVKAVKKATKIKAEKDMYAAFGWLAKEGKLAFEEIEGEMYVSFSVNIEERLQELGRAVRFFWTAFFLSIRFLSK